jgi:geranylgeranyl diphosphate synthase type II
MAYNLWKEDVMPALPAALAIEYFHNFSLMHDDIMDEAPLRRGKQSVHVLFGRNGAILSGDAMLIQCFDLLLEAGKETGQGAALCALMCQAALEICEGQQLDMDFEKLDSPSESEYLEMIRQKTACLLGMSMQMGALLAGASQNEAKLLYNFGEKMGLGFQVQDDFLDVYGDESLTGKQKGGDILRGKKNFLFVAACNQLSPADRENFMETYAMASANKDTSPVFAIYEKLHIREAILSVQTDFLEEAMTGLGQLKGVDSSQIHLLARKLTERNF